MAPCWLAENRGIRERITTWSGNVLRRFEASWLCSWRERQSNGDQLRSMACGSFIPGVSKLRLTDVLAAIRELRAVLPAQQEHEDELFYLNGDTLMSIAVSTQAGDLALGVPRPLFEYPGLFEYDVAPDGQRFVLRTVNPEALAREIRVVLNWFEELKAKVGN